MVRTVGLFVVAVIVLLRAVPFAMDLSRKATRTDDAVAKYGVTGRGVTIAIADRGIDWRHPDFIKPDGTTRIKWLLDMSGQNGCSGTPVPKEFSEAQINAALHGGLPIPSDDYVGHGTVTAGLAAGNGRAFASGKYRGMAPEADLVIVKASGGAPAHDLIPAEPDFTACFPDALEWMASKIELLGQPAVATFNYGSQWGPMDGTDAFSRRVDALFGLDKPGFIYVAPPGDDGGIPNHAGGTYAADADTVVRFAKSDATTGWGNLWYSGANPAQITVSFEDGSVVGPVLPGNSLNQNGIAVYQYDYWQSTSGDGAVLFTIDKPAGAGAIRIRSLVGGQGRFDVYATGTLTFLDHLVPGRLTSMAAIKSAIVPAVVINRGLTTYIDGFERSCDGQAAGELWAHSPPGPTRDGRLGIDVAVPGHCAFAAYGQNSWWKSIPGNLINDGGGWYGAGGGGSGAGPIMTGAVALMLQLYPALTARQIKQVLHDSAVRDAATGNTPNPDWGYGRLDMLRALDAIAALKPQPTITTQPQSQTLAPGQAVSLSVVATGTAPLSYQWYIGTRPITTNPVGGATSSTYTTPGLTSNTRYWVRVSNAAGSADSNTATISVSFTDDLLIAQASLIRAVHFMELRTRIDALRVKYGRSTFLWTDNSVLAGMMMSAVHLTELRIALEQAYTAAGESPPTFTGSPIVPGTTFIRAVHITELRDAVLVLEGR